MVAIDDCNKHGASGQSFVYRLLDMQHIDHILRELFIQERTFGKQ